MASPPVQTLDFRRHLNLRTHQIVNANFLHFLSLSIFFLPLSLSLTIYSHTIFESFVYQSLTTHFEPLKTLVLFLFTFFPSISGVATITYSTHQAMQGKPLNLISAVKSLSQSFLPLLSAATAGVLSVILASLAFVLSVIILTKGVKFLAFEIDYTLYYSILVSAVVAIALVLAIISVMKILRFLIGYTTYWSFAGAIAVVESTLGLEPLRRSKFLLREMKSESASILLAHVIMIGFMIWSNRVIYMYPDVGPWWNLAAVLQTALASGYSALMMLRYAAANTVLYVFCKGLYGGESGSEIKEKVAGVGEYVSLRVDDEEEEENVVGRVFHGAFDYVCVFLNLFWFVFVVIYLVYLAM